MPTPDEIAQRRFVVSLRGYDREQVHAFLAEVSRHVAELERSKEELAAQAASARSADPDEPEVPSRPFAALGEETQRVLEAAQEAAAAIGRKARQEADRQIQAARQSAAKAIAEGERRRDEIDQVISRLEQRRDALARELATLGGVIEQALSDLVPEEQAPTVREALRQGVAEAARAGGEPHGGAPAGSAMVGGGAGAEATAVVGDTVPEAQGQGSPESVAGDPWSDTHDPGSDVGGQGDPDDQGAGRAGHAPPARSARAATEDAAHGGTGLADGPPADRAPVPPDMVGDRDAGEGVAAAQADAAGAAAADPAGADPADAADTAGAAAADPADAADAVTEDAAEDLTVNVGTAADAVTAPDPDPDADGDGVPAEVVARDGSDPSSPVALRAGALEPLHPKMVRRLKRGMSDVQNLVLDRLRRTTRKQDAEALMPGEEDLAVVAEVGQAFLDQAYEAGVRAAAVLAGRHLADPTRPRAFDGDFAADSGDRIRESLVVSLRIGIEGGEPTSALNDRVGAVFSDLKSTAADELAAIHLIRAYEFGLLDAWAAGGVSERAWLLGRELRCPAGRCRQNDEMGAVDVKKAFPSGHEVPPVHVGCTCTTIPALEQ